MKITKQQLKAMDRLTMSRTSMGEKKPHLAIKNLQDAVVMLIQEISNLKTTN